jgi:inner membrane protein
MLVLGHAGITLGAAVVLNGALLKVAPRQLKASLELHVETHTAQENPTGRMSSWFVALGNRLDIRILLVGSLLPDIIDKPVGQLIFRETFNNGRIFSHTLLFLILIAVAGFLLYWRRRRTWLLALSFGTFTHLILDQMWLDVKTLLWPLYGFSFERLDLTGWPQRTWMALLTDPGIYIPEIVGGVILLLLLWVLVRNRNLFAFIKNGRVR